MFEKEIDRLVQDFDIRLRQQNLDMNMYLAFSGMDENKFRETFREQAEKSVKVRLALEKIAALEKLQVTPEEMTAEAEAIAKRYNIGVDRVRSIVNPADLAADILVKNAGKIVKDNAVIK